MKKFFEEHENVVGFTLSVLAGIAAIWLVFKVLPVSWRQKIVGA